MLRRCRRTDQRSDGEGENEETEDMGGCDGRIARCYVCEVDCCWRDVGRSTDTCVGVEPDQTLSPYSWEGSLRRATYRLS